MCIDPEIRERIRICSLLSNFNHQKLNYLVYELKIPLRCIPPEVELFEFRLAHLIDWVNKEKINNVSISDDLIFWVSEIDRRGVPRSHSFPTPQTRRNPCLIFLEKELPIYIWNITLQAWVEIPGGVSNIPRSSTYNARAWKRLHTIVEILLNRYTALLLRVESCNQTGLLYEQIDDQNIREKLGIEAEDRRRRASIFYENLMNDGDYRRASDGLSKLQGGYLQVLSQIPLCRAIIQKSLGYSVYSLGFRDGVKLIERTTILLSDTLRVADRHLELFFQKDQAS